MGLRPSALAWMLKPPQATEQAFFSFHCEGSGISSVVMAASVFRPVLGSTPGSNTELDRRSANRSLQSGNGEPGSE